MLLCKPHSRRKKKTSLSKRLIVFTGHWASWTFSPRLLLGVGLLRLLLSVVVVQEVVALLHLLVVGRNGLPRKSKASRDSDTPNLSFFVDGKVKVTNIID